MNRYHNLMNSVFHSGCIQSDLTNRLVIGAATNGTLRLGRLPYDTFVSICDENGGKWRKETYRTVHRDLGSFEIAHLRCAFDGFEHMPRFGGTGGWAMKILQFPILFGGVPIVTTTYRLYYTKLHLIFNLDRSLLEVKFHYEVEIFNVDHNKWEPMAAPKRKNN